MKKLIILCTISILLANAYLPKAMASSVLQPNISSEAAILIDTTSGDVLYAKNSEELMFPASITKIATAIYAIENGALDDIVTVSENARNADGTKVYLEAGEQVSLLMLIQGMMINSGNDAAIAIAEHLSGSVEQFSEDINAYLKEKVGVEYTNFVNPSGLFDPNHQTTAADMAKMTQYALKNDQFREIFGTAELDWKVETWDTTIYNHHKLLRETPYEGVIGGKNGYVDKAGFTLVTAAEREDLHLIAVTLQAETADQSYQDTIALLDFGFANFKTDQVEAQIFTESSSEEFSLQEPLFYTIEKDEKVTQEITSSGDLMITDEAGRVISEAELEPVEKEAPDEKLLSETVENTEHNPNKSSLHSHFPTILLISFATVFLFVGFLLIQVRRI